MTEKALQLAASGKKVAFLLCYDTFDPIKNQHADVKEEDHFLFQALKRKFMQFGVGINNDNINLCTNFKVPRSEVKVTEVT